MKKLVIVAVMFFLLSSIGLFAQEILAKDTFSSMGNWQPAAGNWVVKSGKLYQLDAEEPLAKINRRVPQYGPIQYEFNIKYVDGGGDGHAGFGIHVFVDQAHRGKSWGNGRSILLWLNYDVNTKAEEHYGFRGQVYRSVSHSKMELMEDYNIRIPTSSLKMEYLNYTIPVKMKLYPDTGEVRVYNPARKDYFYRFYLPGFASGVKGSYMSLRTNSLAVMFDDVTVSEIR